MGDISVISVCNHKVRTHQQADGMIMYNLKDVATLLCLKNPRENASFQHLNTKLIKTVTTGGKQEMCYIDMCSLKVMLSKSRKPVAGQVCKALGFDVCDMYSPAVESSSLSFIMACFDGESMKLQHKVGPYYVDLYFDVHGIAVECDEQGSRHQSCKGITADLHRQRFIENELSCVFVRFVPRKGDSLYLAGTINTIRKLLNDRQLCPARR